MSLINDVKKVNIQTKSLCNARCVFCPYSVSWSHSNPGSMSIKTYTKILSDLEHLKGFRVFSPYFLNEPLMDPRIFDWIELFYGRFPDRFVELSCNPSLLTRKNRSKLIKTFCDRYHQLLISFHGINRMTFEYVMGLPFKVCLENVVELLKESDLNVKIRGSGVSADNQTVYFRVVDYVRFWDQVCDEYDVPRHKVSLEFFNFDHRLRLSYSKNSDCMPQRNLNILWNGDILLCEMDYMRSNVLGNINEINIAEFYSKYNEILQKIREDPKSVCKRCSIQ